MTTLKPSLNSAQFSQAHIQEYWKSKRKFSFVKHFKVFSTSATLLYKSKIQNNKLLLNIDLSFLLKTMYFYQSWSLISTEKFKFKKSQSCLIAFVIGVYLPWNAKEIFQERKPFNNKNCENYIYILKIWEWNSI